MIGIRVVGLLGSVVIRDDRALGQWVKEYDPDAHRGRGDLVTTGNPKEAKAFAGIEEALTFARQQSRLRPLRWDGQPNRPMTAFTLSFEKIPEVES